MLIKKSIVEKWYQTDSWVYKNFSYLFKNPLWSKRIPNGFTVCPYFWMSLFSMFVFKPFFVFPLKYIFIPILKFFGKPASAIDERLLKFYKNIFGMPDDTPGLGIMFSIGVIVVISLIGILITALWSAWTTDYYLIMTIRGGPFAIFSSASFVLLGGIIGLHKAITKTECKTINYIYVWLALFLICACVGFPHEIASIISIIVGGIYDFIVTIGHVIWFSISFAFIYLWKMITYEPFRQAHMWWGAYIIFLAIFAWIINKFTIWIENINQRHYSNSPEENYQVWLNKLVDILVISKYWETGRCFIDSDEWGKEYNKNISNNDFVLESCMFFKRQIYKAALEIYMKDILKKLKKINPLSISNEDYKSINSLSSSPIRFYSFFNDILKFSPKVKLSTYNFDDNHFVEIIKSVINDDVEINKRVNDLAIDLAENAKRKIIREEAAKNKWTHQACIKVTNTISNSIKNIFNTMKWIGSQTTTFFAYMWILVKAKKQGACPYFPFSEPKKSKKST